MSALAIQERLMQVILGPHVSEKSTAVAEGASQVVFRVRRDATKTEIRRAVEMLFEVRVDSVSGTGAGALESKTISFETRYVGHGPYELAVNLE